MTSDSHYVRQLINNVMYLTLILNVQTNGSLWLINKSVASWVPLTTGLSLISPTGLIQSLLVPLPLSYHLHLVVFPKLFLRFHSVNNLCPTYCVNCILLWCQSTAICWQYTAFSLPFSCILSSSLCSLQQCVSSLHSWFIHNVQAGSKSN